MPRWGFVLQEVDTTIRQAGNIVWGLEKSDTLARHIGGGAASAKV
jgi:hypothetical protein